MTTDNLGSPRVITDADGEVISRRDFMPFGEELGVGVGPRTEALKYSYLGSDRVRQRFTGYEKDDETGLDFAEARMYQNKHGRFTAPDPLLASASATNPQTFNRYIYTGNNPVNYTDPSGLTFCKSNSSGMIGWNGAIGKPCGDGFSPVDDKEITLGNRSGGNDSYGNKITPGSTVRFNADGTTRVVRTSAQNQAIAQGQSVTAASGDTPGQTAAEAAASGASGSSSGNPDETSSTGSGGASDVLGLGSCAGSVCEIPVRKEPMPAIDLQGLKTVEGIARGFEACTLVPGLGSACGIGAAIVRGGQGDLGGVGDNLLNAVPFVGWLRKADKAADVAKGAHTVYQGFDAAGVVRYVGMTARQPAIRFAEHAKAIGTGKELLKYRLVKGAEGLPKMQARILEQKLINEHGLGSLLNKINSIAPKYWRQHGIR